MYTPRRGTNIQKLYLQPYLCFKNIFKSFWYSRWLCPQKFEWKNMEKLPPKWSNLSSESFGTCEIDQVDRVERPFPLCLIHPCRCHIFLTGSACAHLIICTPRSIFNHRWFPLSNGVPWKLPPKSYQNQCKWRVFWPGKVCWLKTKRKPPGIFEKFFTTSSTHQRLTAASKMYNKFNRWLVVIGSCCCPWPPTIFFQTTQVKQLITALKVGFFNCWQWDHFHSC